MFYNGIELPALPTWDASEYPVACIIQCQNDSARQLYGGADYTGDYVFAMGTHYTQSGRIVLNGLGGMYKLNGGAWVRTSFGGKSADVTYDGWYAPLWTNTDIVLSDGTIYLPASEPTSGETEADPMKHFMMLFLAGLCSEGGI